HAGELVAPAPGAGSYQDFIHVHQEIRNRDKHNQLQADLIEHMWNHVGNQPNNPQDYPFVTFFIYLFRVENNI
ncbi:hypothetical protein QN366_23675, partial [Pseudomonas sp. CCC3.2]|uniref:hypothetical protein n=1 Tax=Pseudomonas sp. CCC3.2 TaxID=3048608 RepID=UPI002B230FD3